MPRLIPVALAIACLLFTACDDDPAKPKKITPSAYKDLTQEWHVLNNLAQACDDKNIDRYGELLDADNFTFFFRPSDVGGALNIPEKWGHAEEFQSATNMFSGAGGLESNPILTIDVSLFDVEQAQWVETTRPEFPGETLHATVVFYDYFIDTVQDRQFITAGNPTARFVVRNIGGKWKLVEWADLDDGGFQRISTLSTEESSWGQVKALYQ